MALRRKLPGGRRRLIDDRCGAGMGDTMVERTRAGLAAAATNRHGGRHRKVDAAAAARARELKGKESAPPTSVKYWE